MEKEDELEKSVKQMFNENKDDIQIFNENKRRAWANIRTIKGLYKGPKLEVKIVYTVWTNPMIRSKNFIIYVFEKMKTHWNSKTREVYATRIMGGTDLVDDLESYCISLKDFFGPPSITLWRQSNSFSIALIEAYKLYCGMLFQFSKMDVVLVLVKVLLLYNIRALVELVPAEGTDDFHYNLELHGSRPDNPVNILVLSSRKYTVVESLTHYTGAGGMGCFVEYVLQLINVREETGKMEIEHILEELDVSQKINLLSPS